MDTSVGFGNCLGLGEEREEEIKDNISFEFSWLGDLKKNRKKSSYLGKNDEFSFGWFGFKVLLGK